MLALSVLRGISKEIVTAGAMPFPSRDGAHPTTHFSRSFLFQKILWANQNYCKGRCPLFHCIL